MGEEEEEVVVERVGSGWEAGRRSTAAAHCWQRENVPVISQHRYRQGKKKIYGERERRRGKGKKSKALKTSLLPA